MATSVTRNVSIRLVVVEGDKAIRTINNFGDISDRAIRKIVDATAPASKGLMAISVVSEQVRFGMEGLAGNAGTLGLSLGRLGPAGLAAAAAIGAVTYAIIESVKAFSESEKSLNRLNTALTTTQYAAGVTSREISELAEELERATLFSDEQAQDAATALLYFRNIAEDTFKRALRLSLDYAQANEVDVVSAARLVGRALQDPTEGLKKLEGVTTELTESEKELIKRLSETGNVAAAQKIILDKLAASIGGQAEGANKGLAGQANTLGDEWDKLLESFGQTVSQSSTAAGGIYLLTEAVTALRKSIAPNRKEEVEQLTQEISDYQNSLLRGRLDAAFGLEAPNITKARKRLQEIAAEDRQEEENRRIADQKSKEKAIADGNEALLSIEREYLKRRKDATQTERDKLAEDAQLAKERIQQLFKDDGNSDAARKATEAVDENLRSRLAKLDEEAAKPALALAEANNKIVESLQKRAALEGLGDPRSKFIQAEVDKLNASATDAYRQKVAELAGALYDRQKATEAAKEADEAYKKAVQDINREVIRLKPSYDVAKQALDEWMQQMVNDLGTATEESQRYLAVLQEIYELRLKDIYQKSLENSRKWEDGVTRGLSKYANEATNAAKNAEELFGSAANKVEDTLVDMVSTGEFSFKKLGDLVLSIEQDILRIFIRQNITGPIAGGLSKALGGGGSSGDQGIFGSFFDDIFSAIMHSGGVVGETNTARRSMPAYAFVGAPRLHNGLMPDEFPAILQKGETVIPKNQKMMGGMNVTFNISTPNPQAFMDSRGQMLSKFAGEIQRMRTRNG